MVILCHRPDAFEQDDPRGGEVDLILGKHRNGPTKTITVAHQLHLLRFANMAKQSVASVGSQTRCPILK
jgi:replicative DNA helicase